MNLTWPSKDPDEVLDYSWPVPLDEGDTIDSILACEVVAGTITMGSPSNASGIITVVISGGAPGENAIVKIGVQTIGGRKHFEDFLLKLNDAAAVPTDADDLRADIIALETAQMNLASGKLVTEVWRSGRRLIYGKVTLESLQTLIAFKTRKLEEAEQAAQGKKRRRAITLGWPA